MYLGNQPALSYTSFAKQDFTTSATTSYTLDNPVTNENELALFINFVRQEPTTAYTASGTSLTLTSATSASDDMYCVYLGKAVQTVNPPSGSVGTSQLADSSVTNAKLQNSSITLNGSAVSLGGSATVGGTNTPAFYAERSIEQTISTNTETKIIFNSEIYDTDNAYDTSTGVFTAPSAGKYIIFFAVRRGGFASNRFFAELRTTGNPNNFVSENASNDTVHGSVVGTQLVSMSANDTAYVNIYHDRGSNGNITGDVTFFGAFKIIE